MKKNEVRVNYDIVIFRNNYRHLLSDNPVYCLSLDHIANIFHGCYTDRFFLQEFIQSEGELYLNNGSSYLAYSWDFKIIDQGVELTQNLSSLLGYSLNSYQEECLELLFSFILFIWRHTSTLKQSRSYLSYSENLIERILIVKESLKELKVFEVSSFLSRDSYSFVPNYSKHRFKYFHISVSTEFAVSHAIKIPDLLLFGSPGSLPYKKVTQPLEDGSSKLYAGLTQDLIICQGIYLLRGMKKSQLCVYQNDTLLYEDARRFAAVLRIR